MMCLYQSENPEPIDTSYHYLFLCLKSILRRRHTKEEQVIVCHKTGGMIEVLCIVVWETNFGLNSPETMSFIADCCKLAPEEKQPGQVRVHCDRF